MHRLRGVHLIATGALLLACAKSPSEKDVVDSMVSWIGTGDMAAQAWLNHSTLDRYTRETLELSAQTLDQQLDQLKESAPRHSLQLDSAVANARHSMTQIAGLIAAKNAPAVQPQLDSLRAAKRIVLAISDSLGKQK